MSQQKIKQIKVNELRLWSENPRDPIDHKSTDFDVIKRAIDDNPDQWNLDKLVKEMGAHYDFSEIPTVVYLEGIPVVFDGNRRVAVLKYLQNKELYSTLTGKLFYNDGPKGLRELHEIPCNVCDKETALTNIERKHVNNGSWGTIQREYFLHQHRGQPKSLFLLIEEQTGLISAFPIMNQGFVKDEILTEKNLKDVGFGLKDTKLISIYKDKQQEKDILQKVGSLVEDKDITTRKNRGLLKKPLLAKYPENKNIIKTLNESQTNEDVTTRFDSVSDASVRRTSITSTSDELFGRKLILESGPVNNLYCGVTDVYERFKDKENVLPIIAMSFRLILDVAGRLYYESRDETISQEDQISNRFIKDAKSALKKDWAQMKKNSTSLTLEWISDKYSLEAILHKFAHGNIDYSKQTIVQTSKIVAEILEYYFKKKSK
ncbi:MAG: hypothetical protein NTX65_05150 [Ignavibacteriales bacterium]|nr:hypothetical protein [Ignavibacteriales bacterium]